MNEPTQAERVAELHRQAAADYAAARERRLLTAADRNQLADARTHGNEAASTR